MRQGYINYQTSIFVISQLKERIQGRLEVLDDETLEYYEDHEAEVKGTAAEKRKVLAEFWKRMMLD